MLHPRGDLPSICSRYVVIASVVGGIAMQSVLGFIKKTFKKIFTKVLKKEVANVKEKMDNNKGS